MASSNISWGIEVGAHAIKALKLENAGEMLNVLDFAVIPHPKPLSAPDTNPADVLRVSLGTLASQYDLSRASIAVSVPGHSSFARFAKLPPVEPKKVPDIVKFEAVQQIPFPLEQVEWDYQTFVSPDSPDVEVGIFAITRERIMERLGMFQEIGLVPDHVTLSPIAAYNALAYDLQFTEKTPGTVILDVGTTATDLVVAEAGRVWVRTFPIGGHQFTEALVNQFKLGYPKAEKLKREAQDSKHARHIFQAMRPVFTDLAQDVQRSIGYYQSLHRDANLVRLIGVGSTFHLPGLRKYLKQQLSMEVYRIEEFKRLKFEAKGQHADARAKEFADSSLNLATAYGLALQGLGLNAIKANLMPVSVMRESMWKRKTKWFGLAAGLAVAASAAMFIRPFLDSSAVAGTAPAPLINSTISKASQLKKAAEEAGVVGTAAADNRVANMMLLLEGRGIIPRIVDDLGLMMGSADQRLAPWVADPARSSSPKSAGLPPAYTVRTFNTEYLPPSAAAEEAPAEEAPQDDGGGRGGRFQSGGEGRGRGGGGGRGGGANEPFPDKQRVKVTMTVSTTAPDAQRFIIDTLQRWLKDNAVRPGVPYRIHVNDKPWTFIEQKEAAEATAAVGQPPAGGGGGGGRGEVIEEGGGRGGRGFAGRGGDGGGPPESGGRQPVGAADVDKFAPLAPPPSPYEPGTKMTTFRVEWLVVIEPEVKPEGEAAGREGGAK
ncbi:MAG: type IV pilus assembly protein PilM [Phycisphaerales bacterium]|nr:type IV pilus assembly protein PilM [Phycisphaerales bacterium]